MSTQSTGNSEETRLIFESVVPAVTGEENDNDTLFITDDGTETGNILEMWKFDIETQSWYKIPNPICETLDYTIIDDTRPISRVAANAGLRIKWESNITLTPSNVVGAIVTTDQAFFEMPNGDKIPLKVTVERRTTGGWSIFISANWGMSNTPWSADYQITVEILPDCFGNTFDGALMSIIPTSVWWWEALLFSQPYPIEEYIRWPWAPALTLPYVWFWNNNNNNNTSALWFWVSDTISFRANWQNRISSNISVWLRTIPWYKEYDVCQILEFSKEYTDRAIENIQDQDTFGTVTQATANLTTTNEVDITPDDFHIAFPDGTTWASPTCPEEMTRWQLRNLRNAWRLSKDCHYVITDPEPNGTLLLEKVLIHAVDESTLSGCYLKTAHDNIAWNGTYDIDSNDVLEVTDNRDNHVRHNVSIINFPWGVNTVYDNTVIWWRIIDGWATRISWNTLGISTVLNVSGGATYNNTLGENAEATFTSGSNISNTFEQDCTYRQAWTGYIRYSRVWNNSNVVNGNTNISNKDILDTQLNTTGSSGVISWGTFSGAVLNALQNIPSLTLNNVSVLAWSTISASGATRLYCNGNTVTGTWRILVSANAQLDVNYGGCYSNSGYINVTQGKLTVNNCNCMNGYIQHSSTWTNIVAERTLDDGYIRFLNTCTGNRVYYGSQTSYIDVSWTSTNSYIYWGNANSNGKLFIQDSVNARMYYCDSDSNGTIRSRWNTGTHYMYYCKASASSTVEMLDKTGWRMYSVSAISTSIARFQWAWWGNLYYSSFSANHYALLSATTGTRSGLFWQWTRTLTLTNPTTTTPYALGASWLNYQ